MTKLQQLEYNLNILYPPVVKFAGLKSAGKNDSFSPKYQPAIDALKWVKDRSYDFGRWVGGWNDQTKPLSNEAALGRAAMGALPLGVLGLGGGAVLSGLSGGNPIGGALLGGLGLAALGAGAGYFAPHLIRGGLKVWRDYNDKKYADNDLFKTTNNAIINVVEKKLTDKGLTLEPPKETSTPAVAPDSMPVPPASVSVNTP